MRAPEPKACSTRAVLLCVAVVGSLALLLSTPLELDARNRDSDASRMQARMIDFPSDHSDHLNPPDDRVDWRYFKLEDASTVEIYATFVARGLTAQIRLTSATGRELAAGRADGKTASIARKLDPGVYYVGVEADAQTDYDLSVR